MTSTTAMSSRLEGETMENRLHKLKLQWFMAKSDAERAHASEEIRKLTGFKSSS